MTRTAHVSKAPLRSDATGLVASISRISPLARLANQANSIALRACMRTAGTMTPQFAPCCPWWNAAVGARKGGVVSFNPRDSTRFGEARDRLPRGFERDAHENRRTTPIEDSITSAAADQASLSRIPAMPRPRPLRASGDPAGPRGRNRSHCPRSSGATCDRTIDGDADIGGAGACWQHSSAPPGKSGNNGTISAGKASRSTLRQ